MPLSRLRPQSLLWSYQVGVETLFALSPVLGLLDLAKALLESRIKERSYSNTWGRKRFQLACSSYAES